MNTDVIVVGKVLPSRPNKGKYGAPPRGKTLYCEYFSKEGKPIKYNFYFFKASAYIYQKIGITQMGIILDVISV